MAHLLLFEKLPDKNELENFTVRLKKERNIPCEIIEALKTRQVDSLPMDILQTANFLYMLRGEIPDEDVEHFEEA